jgi:hypothetical protein
MSVDLNDKEADVESIARKAITDEGLPAELLQGLESKNETYRYNCYKVLRIICVDHGELLYPQWDYLVGHLDSNNTYHKLSALDLIADLTKVDIGHRFEQIVDDYFGLLDDRSMIAAVYAARNAGKIITAKPDMEARITQKLLTIDRTHHEPGRKDLIKAGAIESFDLYFEQAADKEGILSFVRQQVDSESPKCRNQADAFLRRWDR